MAANRLLFGAFTVWTIIVIRFHLEATREDEVNGLAALGGVALAIGLGLVVAALAAPSAGAVQAVRRAAATVALTVAGVGAVVPLLSAPARSPARRLGADRRGRTAAQDHRRHRAAAAVDDDLRGRIFIAYDIVFNAAFVVGRHRGGGAADDIPRRNARRPRPSV